MATAVCVFVCLSVPRYIPTLLHRPTCNLGVPSGCALLGGFAISPWVLYSLCGWLSVLASVTSYLCYWCWWHRPQCWRRWLYFCVFIQLALFSRCTEAYSSCPTKEPLRFLEQVLLQIMCSSCHPNNGVRTLKGHNTLAGCVPDPQYTEPPPPQPFYGPLSGTTRVSRCQKRTSGLYGARED